MADYLFIAQFVCLHEWTWADNEDRTLNYSATSPKTKIYVSPRTPTPTSSCDVCLRLCCPRARPFGNVTAMPLHPWMRSSSLAWGTLSLTSAGLEKRAAEEKTWKAPTRSTDGDPDVVPPRRELSIQKDSNSKSLPRTSTTRNNLISSYTSRISSMRRRRAKTPKRQPTNREPVVDRSLISTPRTPLSLPSITGGCAALQEDV